MQILNLICLGIFISFGTDFWARFYYVHAEILWGNKQIKNAVEAWEKTFPHHFWSHVQVSWPKSWTLVKGHDLYFHSKNGFQTGFSTEFEHLSRLFFWGWKTHAGQISSWEKTLKNKLGKNSRTRPTFAYFTHFLKQKFSAHLPFNDVLSSAYFLRALWVFMWEVC